MEDHDVPDLFVRYDNLPVAFVMRPNGAVRQRVRNTTLSDEEVIMMLIFLLKNILQ